ncbi:hypothetical protein NC653_036404 [Populus alba x Populus x berolinensis]|uniref:Uncharacterized protein n=1 Tax=Populus alba x Populus x berolinensis TaxID=444605 RepID=A0AAD6PUM2_9ROSI|nr:hypothetical protein NC653_036404 [Populus alba x Populus x berolinensis]
MMINPKACFSKHSQWPSKCFRLRQVVASGFLGGFWAFSSVVNPDRSGRNKLLG